MPTFARTSFARLLPQSRISIFAGILKAVISGEWLVARKSPNADCSQDETKFRNVRPRKLALHSPLLTALLLLSLATSHSPLLCQTGLATLSGTVTDPTGALVTNALVTVTNEDTNVAQKTQTTRAGVYVVEALNPGKYRVVVEHQGFKQIEVLHLVLHTQDVISRNFVLPVGAVSEMIQVNGNQSTANDSPAVSLTVTQEFIEDMPLNGRSLQDLESLAPGAAYSNNTGEYSINGQRYDANYFTVDGVSANTNPGVNNIAGPSTSGVLPAQTALGTTQGLASVDALQEFTIQTSGYAAEYGRQPGGQVSFTTRSGTNTLHGSLFDYLRNEAFDANSWYADNSGAPRPPERQNDFGGTFGGPLLIPHMYNGKDRTFYFVSYEGLRLKLPEFDKENDPMPSFRSAAAPSVQPFLNALPIPNGSPTGDGVNAIFASSYTNPNTLDSPSVRVDQNVGSRLRIFVRYSGTQSAEAFRNQPASNVFHQTDNTYSGTLGATATLGPGLANEARFNYSRSTGYVGTSFDDFGGAVPYAASTIVANSFLTNPSSGGTLVLCYNFLLNVQGTSCNGYMQTGRSVVQQHQYNLVDSISWVKGKHTVKAGVDFRRLLPVYQPQAYQSNIQQLTQADYQQGFAESLSVTARQTGFPIFDNLSLFLQDHWKVSSRLSLDYGVRWELNPVPGSANGIVPLALTQLSNLATTQVAPTGTPAYSAQHDLFAPRLGFAYQLNSSTHLPLTIRGGVGNFYDTGQSGAASGFNGYPFTAVAASQSNVALPFSQAALTAPSLSFALTPPYGFLYVVDPALKIPYTEQWNLTVDQGLGSRNHFTVSYVGNSGKRLLTQIFEFGGSTNPNFSSGLAVTGSQGGSHYGALQVQDNGRLLPGLQVVSSYTYSHAFDNASDEESLGFYGLVWGNSDVDVRQNFNVALNYEVPGGHATGTLGTLSRGWLFASRFSAQSGFPFSVLSGYFSVPGSGLFGQAGADSVPGEAVYLHGVAGVPGGWRLNPAAFVPVPTDPNTGVPLRLGTSPRNGPHGPSFWSNNLSMQRMFPIYDRSNLRFRVDAFNVFNHPNFGHIDNSLGDTTFGQAQSVQTVGSPNQLYATGAPRSLQLSLNLSF